MDERPVEGRSRILQSAVQDSRPVPPTLSAGKGRHEVVVLERAGHKVAFVCGIAALALVACSLPPSASAVPSVGQCNVFPSDNAWNTDISDFPVRSNSAQVMANIAALGGNQELHPDFGGNGEYGIPFSVVSPSEPLRPIVYTDYGDESDPGPFPIPPTAPVEGGSDRHVIVVQNGTCHLFELYNASWSVNHWNASSGANWNLASNARRPLGWTSADAAGLPILPGLVRYDEVAAGEVRHAIRVTFSRTQAGYVVPATHFASSSTDPNRPAMGYRFRLKASYDLAAFHGASLVILTAMKRYGLIVADNSSNWYFTGAADPRWDDDDLNQMKSVPGSAFELVDTGPVHTSSTAPRVYGRSLAVFV